MEIQIKGLDKAVQNMRDRAKRLPLAAYNALNVTGNDIIRNLRTVMKNVFDRPTPFIMRAFEKKFYGADNGSYRGDLMLTIWVDPFNHAAVNVLRPEIFGGERALKPSEVYLRNAGILPPGKYIAAAPGAWKDAYGNIPGGEMIRILSDMRLFPETGYKMNRTTKKGKYFVMKRGGVPVGIYESVFGRNIVPVVMFVSKPGYKPRLDFFGIAESTTVATFKKNFLKQSS